MSDAVPVWTLEVIGPPRLLGPAGPRRIDRRSAALLTYLALEGPQPRSRIAGLLWPEVRESAARANLRQLVHRLPDGLVDGADPLALTSNLAVDARTLHDLVRTGDHERVARYHGELLDGVVLDEATELTEWIDAARTRLVDLRRDAALADSARREAAGDFAAALAAAQRAVDLDPIAEPAHRQLMKVHYLAGDRASASAAYVRCRVALRDRLGVEPSSTTTALADEIARSRRGPSRPAAAPPAIPITVLRPPLLAGRAREWAAMERAWAAGQSIILGGPPGVGKSRLMTDFLASHGHPIICSGRPGDRAIPYGTHARTYREMVSAIGRDRVPPWIARELSRLIPELGDPPGPLVTAEDRLRFWTAKTEVHRIAYRLGFTSFGLDDLQFVDEASAEAGSYILSQLRGDPTMPIQTVHCYRTGELPDSTMAIIRTAAEAGVMLHLELEPLRADAVGELLASLAIPGLEQFSADFVRSTGGSPMYILETVKHLLETDGLAQAARLPLAPRVGAVLASRLDRLSPAALELARVLAVLGTDFSFDRAALTLAVSPTSLIPPWDELVAAQILRGEAFAHDLLREAVIAGMPDAIGRLLHRRVAETLDRDAGESARIASHWLDAGEPTLATASRRKALVDSRHTLLEDEAQRYFGD